MAKKRFEQPADDEQEPVEYENVEPEAVDVISAMEAINDAQVTRFEKVWKPLIGASITKPGGAAVSLDTDDRQYRVTFALPYGVLVALLDQEHPDADVDDAEEWGVLSRVLGTATYTPTQFGTVLLIGNSFDKTAVRHKMNAAWREQHNRGVGGVK